jgi:hypothetical protein
MTLTIRMAMRSSWRVLPGRRGRPRRPDLHVPRPAPPPNLQPQGQMSFRCRAAGCAPALAASTTCWPAAGLHAQGSRARSSHRGTQPPWSERRRYRQPCVASARAAREPGPVALAHEVPYEVQLGNDGGPVPVRDLGPQLLQQARSRLATWIELAPYWRISITPRSRYCSQWRTGTTTRSRPWPSCSRPGRPAHAAPSPAAGPRCSRAPGPRWWGR